MMEPKTKGVFFDRDGTVNIRLVSDYITDIKEFHFLPDFPEFFRKIKELGFLAILITNQQGVGKGLMPEEGLVNIHDYMQTQLLKITGYQFDDIYYCTDLNGSNSPRRKPQPGMILEAIEKWNIAPSASWMIGDGISDAKAGRAAGVNTIILGNYSKEDCPEADVIIPNLYIALDLPDFQVK